MKRFFRVAWTLTTSFGLHFLVHPCHGFWGDLGPAFEAILRRFWGHGNLSGKHAETCRYVAIAMTSVKYVLRRACDGMKTA